MQGVEIAFMGGDRREAEAARWLAGHGAQVRVWGQPTRRELEGVVAVARAEEAVREARLLVGPVRGTDGRGGLWSESGPLPLDHAAWQAMEREALFLIGVADAVLREAAARCGVRLVEYRERDDFAIMNSIPTAEGAIFMALKELEITLHGSSCLVLGFGRTGITLARVLQALGSRVTVIARRLEQLVRAEEMGCQAVPLAELGRVAERADVIFNTIPAPVLHAGILRSVSPSCVIIDLASAPGGTDFAYAATRGLRAMLAPGLPGVKAPVTAGRILARVVEHIWNEHR